VNPPTPHAERHAPATAAPPGPLLERLGAGYERLRAAAATTGQVTDLLDEQIDALTLAQAAWRTADRPPVAPAPAHLAVLGPTQTGKSTIVNLLLGRPAADVSPLAGFTIHPQGFWQAPPDAADNWTAGFLPGWERVPQAALDRDRNDQFALERIAAGGASASPAVGDLFAALDTDTQVVWDTPDFDSLRARTYIAGVLAVAGAADVHLLVLSKEKYSDLAVWRLVGVLADLGRPLIVCLNKLTPDAEEPIRRSLRERLAQYCPRQADAPLVTLPHDPRLAESSATDSPAVVELRETVARACADVPRTRAQRRKGVAALVRRHWDDWTAPVRTEHTVLAEWHGLAEQAGADFVRSYRRDYLDHPQRYDSFRRASVELLDLLELPRVGSFLASARRVITWPARQLISAGRDWWNSHDRREAVHSLGVEATVLTDALNALLARLEHEVRRKCGARDPAARVWQALDAALADEGPQLRAQFEAALVRHHEQVLTEVRAAARELYETLKKQPTRLAALRTARASMDLGSILLAVKSGGLSMIDAVWAPAAFGVTSLIMEGFAGIEQRNIDARLKRQQLARVECELVAGTFVAALTALAERLRAGPLFGITPAELDAALPALDAWEQADA
jgi:hypothetical protein